MILITIKKQVLFLKYLWKLAASFAERTGRADVSDARKRRFAEVGADLFGRVGHERARLAVVPFHALVRGALGRRDVAEAATVAGSALGGVRESGFVRVGAARTRLQVLTCLDVFKLCAFLTPCLFKLKYLKYEQS